MDAQFMKEFEKVIQSYTDAVSRDRPEEARDAAMEALLMAGKEALKNPTSSLLLKEEAGNCEAKGDWTGAEAAYRKVLALEEASGNFGLIAKAHMDLCRLLRLRGRLDEARQFALQAAEGARRAQIFPVLVMALDLEACCALDRGDSGAALAAASEGFQVIEPGKIFDLMRAKALVTHARCSLASGDPATADSDLATSWELLQARVSALSPLLTLADWWEVKSQLEEQRGNVEPAREALTRAGGYLRQMQGPYARFAVARVLHESSRLSKQAGDLLAAEQASNEAEAIRNDLRLLPSD
jgi:ATP/maltotriose-dependent transcriptional regulator MalT